MGLFARAVDLTFHPKKCPGNLESHSHVLIPFSYLVSCKHMHGHVRCKHLLACACAYVCVGVCVGWGGGGGYLEEDGHPKNKYLMSKAIV